MGIKGIKQKWIDNPSLIVEEYITDRQPKYKDREFIGIKGLVRSIQDHIGLIKTGGSYHLSEGLYEILQEQGHVYRDQFVFEHKIPLKTYKKEVFRLFKEGSPQEFYDFLYEMTDLCMITKEEDQKIRDNKLVSSLPICGGDRYEVSGIVIKKDILLPNEKILYR